MYGKNEEIVTCVCTDTFKRMKMTDDAVDDADDVAEDDVEDNQFIVARLLNVIAHLV